ncbi:MAG: hypothetical protein QW358_03855 [Candidatus Hadarchaeum sp.]
MEISRRSLIDLLEIALLAAHQAGIPQPEEVGLVEQAIQEVARPYTPQLLRLHQAIKTTFAALGPYQKNRTPEEFYQQLENYRTLIEQRRQQYQQLHQRLSLILTLLQDIAQQKPWIKTLSLQLLLEEPEIFETIINIERLRWETKQICIERLQNSFQNRSTIGEKWINLLKNYITYYNYRLGKRTLKELRHQFQNNSDDIILLKGLHKRLDTPLLNWNRKAINTLN